MRNNNRKQSVLISAIVVDTMCSAHGNVIGRRLYAMTDRQQTKNKHIMPLPLRYDSPWIDRIECADEDLQTSIC